MDRMIFNCECGKSVVVKTCDIQEVNSVLCDCTREMEYEGLENGRN